MSTPTEIDFAIIKMGDGANGIFTASAMTEAFVRHYVERARQTEAAA